MLFSSCFAAMMDSRPVYCIWMFYCTWFSYCCVCKGLGVSWQTVWSLKIGAELLEPQSINNCNWFLIPTDHPQCVGLIQSYKLAVPTKIDFKLLLEREGAQNVLNRKGETRQWNLRIIFGLIGWMCASQVASLHTTEISLLKMQKVYRAAQCNKCLGKKTCSSIFKQANKLLCCI